MSVELGGAHVDVFLERRSSYWPLGTRLVHVTLQYRDGLLNLGAERVDVQVGQLLRHVQLGHVAGVRVLAAVGPASRDNAPAGAHPLDPDSGHHPVLPIPYFRAAGSVRGKFFY